MALPHYQRTSPPLLPGHSVLDQQKLCTVWPGRGKQGVAGLEGPASSLCPVHTRYPHPLALPSPGTLSLPHQRYQYHNASSEVTLWNVLHVCAPPTFICCCCYLCLSRVQFFVTPMDCSPKGSSARGSLQARILEWVAISSSRGFPEPGIKPPSPTWQADTLPLSHLSRYPKLHMLKA